MVAWYWLFIVAWLAGILGLLIGALCAVSGRSNRDK